MRIRAKYVAVNVASARGVAERWRRQYTEPDGTWRLTGPVNARPPEQTYILLCALGEVPDVAEATEIIGNKSWAYISCDGCNEYVVRAVSIGEYEPKQYCFTCIKEAMAVLTEPANP